MSKVQLLSLILNCIMCNYKNIAAASVDPGYMELVKSYGEQLQKVFISKVKDVVLEDRSATFAEENIAGEVILKDGILDMDHKLESLGYELQSQTKNEVEIILIHKIPNISIKFHFNVFITHIGGINGSFYIDSAGLLKSLLVAVPAEKSQCTYKSKGINFKFDGYEAAFRAENGAIEIKTLFEKVQTYANTFNVKNIEPELENILSKHLSEIDVISKNAVDETFLDIMNKALCCF